MYSRSQSGRFGGIRPPEHYSGVAFGQSAPLPDPPPQPIEYCADGLPAPLPLPAAPAALIDTPAPANEEKQKAPPSHADGAETDGGLFASIGREELLLLGIILILAQRPGEDDTILLLLLLLLRR